MNGKLDNLGNSGLQYFGAMSASIAHEIKNALAITNENAGLMEDLSLMVMKSGQQLDPEKMARLSGKVMAQIKRADGIVKKLSRFAHSVDDPVKVVSLNETLELALELGRRSATGYGVTLSPVKSEAEISVETNPFLLMNFLWLVIKQSLKRADSDKKLDFSVSKEQHHATIRITNLKSSEPSDSAPDKMPGDSQDEISALAGFLNIGFDMNTDREIVITLP